MKAASIIGLKGDDTSGDGLITFTTGKIEDSPNH